MKYLVKNNKVMSTENWLDRMGEITIEQFAEDNGFEIFDHEPDQLIEERKKDSLRKELKEIQIWFQINDYIPNKIVTGEWSVDDPRWIEYLSERTQKRNRQDEITVLLSE